MIGGIFVLVLSFSSSALALTICDAVKATANLNVRSSPSTSASILTTKSSGSIGSILGGPVAQGGYTWWHITWLTGYVGWSVQNFLELVSVSPLVYTDNIGIGWCLQPWSYTAVTLQATPSRAGSYSIKTVTSAAWARLYLRTNGKSTAGFNSLRFSVRSESSNGQILYVALYSTSGTPLKYLNVWDYVSGGALSPNTWYDVRIPISDLLAQNQTIGGFVVESKLAATFYIDNAALDTVSGSTRWTPQSPTIISVGVNCSPNSILVNQTSQCSASVSGTGNFNSAVTWSATAGSVNSSGYFTGPSTAANVTVTARSVQDTSKSGNAAITVSAPQASQAASIAYSESVGSGWRYSGWEAVTTNLVSPNAYAGQRGIEVRTHGAWGRLQMLVQGGFKFSTAGYDILSFALNIGKREGERLYVGLLDVNGNIMQYRALSNVAYVEHGAFTQNLWTYVRIHLSHLGGMNQSVYGVEIQSLDPATFYLDNIKFEQNGGCQ